MNSGPAILLGAFFGFIISFMICLVAADNSRITRKYCNQTCFPLQTIICDSDHAGCSDNSVHKIKRQ